MTSMRHLAALIALATAPSVALAQQADGDPAIGQELARQLCTACHIVGQETVGSDVAPPFKTIASDPSLTLNRLHAWVEPAHPVLPDLALGEQEIADINAYLDSLVPGREAEPAPPGAPEGASPRIETEEPPPAILDSPPEEIGPPIVPSPD